MEDVRAYFAANTSLDQIPITYVAVEEGQLCGTVTLDVEDLDLRGTRMSRRGWSVSMWKEPTAAGALAGS